MELSTDKLFEMSQEYGLKLISAVIVLFIGLWVIRMLLRGMNNVMERKQIDPTLRPFFHTLVGIGFRIMLIISVLSMLGIAMTSFVAMLGAAGLAIGLALSGTLQNFAAGVMILLFRPYKVGDAVEMAGYFGIVSEIQIFNTILKTTDNKTIIIPNSKVAGDSLINYTTEGTRRVDFSFGVAYGTSYDHARQVLLDLCNADERILQEPIAPFVALENMNDSSVNLVVRVWVNSADYWGVHFDMREKVYKTFGEKGIAIPFPQMDVHLHNK